MNTTSHKQVRLEPKVFCSWFKKLIFVFSFLIFVGNQSLAQKSKTEELDSIASILFESGKIYGGILVADGGDIIFNKSFGMSDKEAKKENTPNSLFPINSMTKSFTAVLILQLYEEELIKLSDPISFYLPEFKHPKTNEITIHHLLSHRSGIQDYFLIQLKGKMDFDISMNEMLDKVAKMQLEFDPGSGFSYNNTGYVLLAMLVEKLRQISFKDALDKYIFKPLNMNNTTYSSTGKFIGSVKLYDKQGYLAQSNKYFIGDAGIFSTTKDLHKFLLSINSNKLLTKNNWQLALTPHSFPIEANREFPAHFNPYGYGFSLVEWPYKNSKKKITASHGGTGFGSSSYMTRFTGNDRIIIFWNNQFKSPVQPIIYKIMAN